MANLRDTNIDSNIYYYHRQQHPHSTLADADASKFGPLALDKFIAHITVLHLDKVHTKLPPQVSTIRTPHKVHQKD